MDAPLLLDTSVLIEQLRRRPGAAEFVAGLSAPPLISVVSIAELYVGARDELESQRLDRFVKNFAIVPLTAEIARRAGLLRRAHGTKLADAIIAATAEARDATLLTFNVRDFQMLERVREPYAR